MGKLLPTPTLVLTFIAGFVLCLILLVDRSPSGPRKTVSWKLKLNTAATPAGKPLLDAFRQGAILPSRSDISYDDFLHETKAAFEVRRLKQRPLHLLFEDNIVDVPHPACNGFWLEFGVFSGDSINLTAQWHKRHCGSHGYIHGFDTFTGLPENWRDGFRTGQFSLNGRLPIVEEGVSLHKGLFSQSLPAWMKTVMEQDYAFRPVTYLHIDCDLYQGAIDALTLLNDWIPAGCVLLFDELFNYPGSKSHELKALWEWVTKFNRQVEAIGKLGSADLSDQVVDLNAERDLGWFTQSALFVVHR